MPKLPPETERDTKALRKFVIKIPYLSHYQHDIVWWFREFERREKATIEGNGDMTGQELVRR